MKPVEFTQAEVELIHTWLTQRRSSYLDMSHSFVLANQAAHNKLAQELDRVLDSVVVGPSFVKPNGKRLIQGCMEQFVMGEVRATLRQLYELNWPAWYTYVREHPVVMDRTELILNLWNKFVKKEERFQLPSQRLAIYSEVFESKEVFASFSDAKPYKVAFVAPSGLVYRLSLENGNTEVEGPYQYARKDLQAIFMRCLTPEELCRAIEAYGKEDQLHAWHTLLLTEMQGALV